MAGWRDAIGEPQPQEPSSGGGGWRAAIGVSGNQEQEQQPQQQPQDNRRWDQKASDFITQNTPEVLGTAAGKIASGPEFQPFPASQYGLPKPSDVLDTQNPSALGQVMGTARKIASLPGRFSQTLGQASEPVSNAVTSGLGYMGVPAPVSAAAGMVAGVASDPRTYIQTGGISKEQPTGLPMNVAAKREARTGVPAREFQRLYKDPGALLSRGDIKQAGADIGAAKAASGIEPGVTDDLSSLTPENLERINPTKAMKIEDINGVIGKITQGASPTPQEVQNALDGVKSILSQPSVQNNRNVFRQWSAIKTHLKTALGDVAPDVKAANENYARLALRDAFTGSDAVTKAGKPSKLAMLAKKVPAAVGGMVGGSLFGTPGAVGGYELGGDLANLYHSPRAAGIQTAVGSYINNVGNPIVSGMEKGITSPAVGAYIQRLLAQRNQQTNK